MKNIRIGKDISLCWQVTIDNRYEDLSGKDLSLFLHDETRGTAVQLPFVVSGSEIRATYYGTQHAGTGVYRLTLWLNKGKVGQSVVDESTAFCLVERTEMEGGDVDSSLTTEAVSLSGNLSLTNGGDVSGLEERIAAVEVVNVQQQVQIGSLQDAVEQNDIAMLNAASKSAVGLSDAVSVRNMNNEELFQIASATTETAGVMSAAQVQKLNTQASDISALQTAQAQQGNINEYIMDFLQKTASVSLTGIFEFPSGNTLGAMNVGDSKAFSVQRNGITSWDLGRIVSAEDMDALLSAAVAAFKNGGRVSFRGLDVQLFQGIDLRTSRFCGMLLDELRRVYTFAIDFADATLPDKFETSSYVENFYVTRIA